MALENEFDDLEAFMVWWLGKRVINTPTENETNFNGVLSGLVLYRSGQYQVQLFIVQPNSLIESHIHPNVDSFEVFVGGDVEFICDDVVHKQTILGGVVRVRETSWHGGVFGPKGGSFLSIQKWLNNVPPSSVGNDWADKSKNVIGTAVKLQ